MIAEIISIGTEILLGDILNTNARYLSRELAALGISVYFQSVVGDNPERLREVLLEAKSRSDIIITTGGLGPTEDDLSKETASEVFGVSLKEDPIAMNWIKEYFEKRHRTLSENNIKQGLIPEESIPLYNDNGTAPGFILTKEHCSLIMLPGPPSEMAPMFNKGVLPFLKSKQESILESEVLRICGIGEGHMEEEIKDLIIAQSNPTIAPYAKRGEVTLRITAKAKSTQEAQELIKPVKEAIYERLGDNVYGEGDTTLEAVVAEILIKNDLTIATAESCTGGLLSGQLINYPGISKVFKEGFITYSNEAKMNYLNVSSETLRQHGAVSEETACEMALGVARATNSDVGVSITGIAGPTGGTENKPIGLVYIGVSIGEDVKVKKIMCVGDRQKNRFTAVMNALDFLRRQLLISNLH
ncbi:competence/damage-inducible protein A [Vallitalea okinawensis]|uniref:competence/damage-inducible protein A n=1 Tax=Vallitalea okinawensis TaxID=2078660 RepID=UPI000CFB6F64|nr:competence/damage-inducible protein A [Vallitalea okinawensis]